MPIEIVDRAEASTTHSVNVEAALQVIDFVLQDTGVPTGRMDDLRFSLRIEALNLDFPGAWRKGDQPWQAETAFKELDFRG